MSAASVSRVSPANMTGRKKAELAEEHAEELRLREKEISLINAAAAEEKEHGVIDLTEPKHIEAPVVVETQSVEVVKPVREFRVNTKIENMTVGHGNFFDFEEGRTYRAQAHIYDRLDELGYIWH
jgi:hypothetical protein